MPNSLDTVAPQAPMLRVKKPPYKLKLAVNQINPTTVLDPPNEELLAMHREIHRLFNQHFRNNRVEMAEGIGRADLLAAHMAIAIEMQERGYTHKQPVRMMKAGKNVLDTISPRGQHLFSRKIRMLMHSEPNGYPIGQPIIVMQGDQALGEIRLTRPFPINASDFHTMQHLHGLQMNANAKDLAGKQVFAFGVVIHRKYGAPKNVGSIKSRAQHEPIS